VSQTELPAGATMADLYKLPVRGRIVDFHVFVTTQDSESRVRSLARFFERVPDPHLDRLYPILVIEEKPGGKPGGGTWTRRTDFLACFGGGVRSRRTHVPDAELARLVIRPHQGLIAIPRERWERPFHHLPTTVFHEVGHCVDRVWGGLVPRGATDADFAGMNTTSCGAGGPRTRQAVEAYARLIYNPARIYHDLPLGESSQTANTRLLAALRRSPAFNQVSPAWMPASTH
jgi:hypothetical protein